MLKWHNIDSAEEVTYDDVVYDIELDKNHYFKANNIYTHNCRLKNDVSDQINDFSYSLGAGGVMTGSMNVITININRLIQDDRNLEEEITKIHKYQTAFKELFKEYQAHGMLPVYDNGYITLDKQYLTIGINGVVEAAEFLGYTISNNDEYKTWVKNILKTISDTNKEGSSRYKCKFNSEFVPAENLGSKFAKWDEDKCIINITTNEGILRFDSEDIVKVKRDNSYVEIKAKNIKEVDDICLDDYADYVVKN